MARFNDSVQFRVKMIRSGAETPRTKYKNPIIRSATGGRTRKTITGISKITHNFMVFPGATNASFSVLSSCSFRGLSNMACSANPYAISVRRMDATIMATTRKSDLFIPVWVRAK